VVQRFASFASYSLAIGLFIHIIFMVTNYIWMWRTSDAPMLIFILKLIPYFVYVLLGVWLGVNYDRLKSWFEKPWQSIHSGIFFVLIIIWTIVFSLLFTMTEKSDTNLWNETVKLLFIYPSTLLVLVAAFALANKPQQRWRKILYQWGNQSYGIYLIHPLILMWLREWMPMPTQPLHLVLWIIICFSVAMLMTSLIVALLHRYVRWHPYLIGKIGET
jgi:hypothetical protein